MRAILPSGFNEIIGLAKATSIVYVLALPELFYTVQVIWDESMADGAAKWLAATPTGHAVILAGNGHCHDSVTDIPRACHEAYRPIK